MSKMKQIAALTAMLVGVILYTSPVKSAVCFLPDDDGSCGGGDIEISDGSDPDNKPEEKCEDYPVSAADYEKMKNCFDFTSCTKSKTKEVKYKQGEKISGTSWNASNKICCINGETYDSAEGQCCPAGGCTHECDAPKKWSTTLRRCECPNGKETSTGTCCADEDHVDGAICCPEKKHNDGGVCVCDSQYNTDKDGNCVIAGDECPKGYTENKPSSAYKYETKNVGSKVCYKIVDGNWPKTIRVRLETEYYVSNGKYKHIITGASLTFETQDGTVVSSNSFQDEGLPKFQYLYKNDVGDDTVKLDSVYDPKDEQDVNVGSFYFLGSSEKTPFLEFDTKGFYFKDFIMDSDVQGVQEWRNALFAYFNNKKLETSQWTNPLSFKGDIYLEGKQLNKHHLDLQLDVTVYSKKSSETRKCQDIDSSYIGEYDSLECPDSTMYSEVYTGDIGTDGRCRKCFLLTCNEADGDFGNSSLSCPVGYDPKPAEDWAVGSDGICYQCVKQKTEINFEYYIPANEKAGDYCDDGKYIGNSEWHSSYMCPTTECEESHKATWDFNLATGNEAEDFNYSDFVLPFDMKIVIKYKIPYTYRGEDCRSYPTTSWPSKYVDPIYEPKTVTLTLPKGSTFKTFLHEKALDYSGSNAEIERSFYINDVKRETYTKDNITYRFQEI